MSVGNRRERILQEILSSEKTYISNLHVAVQLFLSPLRVTCLLPDSVLTAMFSNIEAILAVNVELVAAMRDMSVGDAFLRLAPFLRLYSLYANNFQRANQLILEWTHRSSEFDGFRKAQESRRECCGLSLPSLLIMPIQRVPRYKLLLEELLKFTPHNDLDWMKLDAACKKISEVADHINEHVRQHENFREMLRIQNSLTGVQDILIPGRFFIREGCLRKLCGRRLKDRMCYLFSDLFVYARPNLMEKVDSTSRYCCRGALQLSFCSVEVDEFCDAPQLLSTAMLLKIRCRSQCLSLLAESDNETQLWFHALNEAIRNLHDQQRCLLEEVQKRVSADTAHTLRNRISTHLEQTLNKTDQVDDLQPTGHTELSATDMTMSSQKGALESTHNQSVDNRKGANSKDNDDGDDNNQTITLTGSGTGLCVPVRKAATRTVTRLQTTTYDVQRQEVHSTICIIL